MPRGTEPDEAPPQPPDRTPAAPVNEPADKPGSIPPSPVREPGPSPRREWAG